MTAPLTAVLQIIVIIFIVAEPIITEAGAGTSVTITNYNSATNVITISEV